jgi:hypothetical protein
MKNSPLATILLFIVAVTAISSVGLCCSYVSKARELRSLQAQANILNYNLTYNRNVITALAGEAVEYGKTHPDLEPILVSAGLGPKGAKAPAAPVPAPAAKPATK